MKKSLHHPADFKEIKERILRLTENSRRKWGKMDAGQMLKHCSFVLQVPQQKLILPPVNRLFRIIGIATRKEMQLFNNGIPRNMPTFQKLIVNFECNFDEEQRNLLKTLDDYLIHFKNGRLPDQHVLFGKMEDRDWGFLEYKHLDHHLKQFNV